MYSKAFLIGLSAIVMAVYPLIVYYSIGHLPLSSLAGLLFAFCLLRVFLLDWQASNNKENNQQLSGGNAPSLPARSARYLQLLLVGGLCLLVVWFQNDQLLRYYPVLMNLSFATLFFWSLSTEKSLIERMMSLVKQDVSAQAKRYMRGLTKIWAALLLANTLISWYTACCLSIQYWALYNGLLAYLIFAIFTLFELVFRHHYKKRHQP